MNTTSPFAKYWAVLLFGVVGLYYALGFHYFGTFHLESSPALPHYFVWWGIVSLTLAIGYKSILSTNSEKDLPLVSFPRLLGYLSASILLILLLIWGYNTFFSIIPFTFPSFLNTAVDLALISILPLLVTLVRLERILKKGSEHSSSSEPTPKNPSLNSKRIPISIIAENGKKQLGIHLSDFILAEASDNYITVYYLSNGTVKKDMLRSSLKNIDEQLCDFEGIHRCHRSFLINQIHLTKIKGVSQAWKLIFKHIDKEIPVSRSFDTSVLKISPTST